MIVTFPKIGVLGVYIYIYIFQYDFDKAADSSAECIISFSGVGPKKGVDRKSHVGNDQK